MATDLGKINTLQQKTWQGSIPLHITLSSIECRSYNDSFPYFIQCPRVSYFPFLLPRLHSFFLPALIHPDIPSHEGWFSFEGVPLKWHHPVGLLYDLFSGATPASLDNDHTSGTERNEITGDDQSPASPLPWKIMLHFSDRPADQLIPLDSDGKIHQDAFVNSVKEADFLRNGTAKVMMSLSKDDSTKLWQSLQTHDLTLFNTINQKFLNPPGAVIRHVPIKVYLPTTTGLEGTPSTATQGTVRVVQSLVTPMLSSKEVQTVGSALHNFLPTLFPSRRSYIHAQAVLHGAVLPINAHIQDLMQGAAYADGFLHISVVMVG